MVDEFCKSSEVKVNLEKINLEIHPPLPPLLRNQQCMLRTSGNQRKWVAFWGSKLKLNEWGRREKSTGDGKVQVRLGCLIVLRPGAGSCPVHVMSKDREEFPKSSEKTISL